MIYESQYVVNSFHAINEATGEVIQANEAGMIQPAVGTTIIFPSPYNEEKQRIEICSLLFKTGMEPIKFYTNDNQMYPIYIPAQTTRTFDYLRIYSITMLTSGYFYVEGLSAES